MSFPEGKNRKELPKLDREQDSAQVKKTHAEEDEGETGAEEDETEGVGDNEEPSEAEVEQRNEYKNLTKIVILEDKELSDIIGMFKDNYIIVVYILFILFATIAALMLIIACISACKRQKINHARTQTIPRRGQIALRRYSAPLVLSYSFETKDY